MFSPNRTSRIRNAEHGMKLRLKEYLRSPLGVWYRICAECATVFRRKRSNAVENQSSLTVRDDAARQRVLSEYWMQDEKTEKKSVLYTCITNGYDDIAEISVPTYVNCKWDYVCFTDDAEHLRQGRIGVWKMRPLAFTLLDGTRNNRWHKFHPDVLFPAYAESIYVDANVDILTDWIFTEISRRNADILLPLHPCRKCIFQEYKMIMSQFMDDPGRILPERRLIKNSGMPKNFGMTENNVIYRRHNSSLVKEMMSECWDMLEKYSKRDQLCVSWVLWKHGLHIGDVAFPSARNDHSNFHVLPHKNH